MHQVIYHMDADGQCAAAIVGYALFNSGVPKTDIYFQAINHGMEVQTKAWGPKDTIWMVDFSLQPLPVMVTFAEAYDDRFIWIDHHLSALQMEVEAPMLSQIRGIRESGLAGCELAWRHCCRDKPLPEAVELIGKWDTWRRGPDWDTHVVPYQSFLFMADTRPQNWEFWKGVLENPVTEFLNVGRVVRAVQDKVDSANMNAGAFVCKFDGLKAIATNGAGNSLMFEKNYEDAFDLMIMYRQIHGKHVTVSLYSMRDSVNCAEIAQRLGMAGPNPSGGGHKGAAGFQCNWAYLETLISDVEDVKPWKKKSTASGSISDLLLK